MIIIIIFKYKFQVNFMKFSILNIVIIVSNRKVINDKYEMITKINA